jgi:epoxyqueuosine reductase
MRIALHACCGPCLLEPLDAVSEESSEVVVVFANPNIQPAEEYARRRDTLVDHARSVGVAVVELAGDPGEWAEQVGVHGSDKEARCRACYRLRMTLVAQWARENGLDAIATTLTVSPYQDASAIAEEGAGAAEDVGLAYLDRDFRERYPDATRRSRELGMYRQNYCGCQFSRVEAEQERAARRARRSSQEER